MDNDVWIPLKKILNEMTDEGPERLMGSKSDDQPQSWLLAAEAVEPLLAKLDMSASKCEKLPRIPRRETKCEYIQLISADLFWSLSAVCCCLRSLSSERLKKLNEPKNRMIYYGEIWDRKHEDHYLIQPAHREGNPSGFYPERVLSNFISTTKYSNLTFLPLNLFEQLQVKANFYFLLIAIVSFTPFSPIGPFTAVFPLVFVLSVAAVKEYYEDYLRGLEDEHENNSEVSVWDCRKKDWIVSYWREIRPGDMVKIVKGKCCAFPADILLLKSNQKSGICYIETSNLDGETNLKLRQALPQTYNIPCKPDGGDYCEKVAFKLKSIPPNEKMDMKSSWYGDLWIVPEEEWDDVRDKVNSQMPAENVQLKRDKVSPGMDQLLLRGASLRNAEWVIGLVVYTGKETKIMMNFKSQHFKRSNVDMIVDKALYWLFATQFLICCGGALGRYAYFVYKADYMWYQDVGSDGHSQDRSQVVEDSILMFFTYFILSSLIIPISLYVSMEMIKFVQASFISLDKQMHNSDLKINASARTSNLNEELGQVNFIFSDKTGTLTRNVMEFHSCRVGLTTYGDGNSEPLEGRKPPPGHPEYSEKSLFNDCRLANEASTSPEIDEFLTLLSVCHTVVPETISDLNVVYQAASPDEKSLVEMAREALYWFRKKEPRTIQFPGEMFDGQVFNVRIRGEDFEFVVYETIKFDSNRKRMSVLVKDPRTKRLKLYTKGADNIIYNLLSEESKIEHWPDAEVALTKFASKGLRTLVCAYREVSDEEFKQWRAEYNETKSLKNRASLVEKKEELEKMLTLIGVTAIEDKLQDEVNDTIRKLSKAGCALWVLTGDKIETAINIARSADLLTERHARDKDTLIVIDIDEKLEDEEGYDKALNILESKWEDLKDKPYSPEDLGLVMSGKVLTFVFPMRIRSHTGHELKPDAEEKKKEDKLQKLVFDISRQCQSVLMCRVTPKQKSELVLLIKRNIPNVITLAVGDGANDVPMIKTAHVGIGVHGKEGKQAVMNSDYAISQFKDLQRLLLVHGAWDYRRLAKLILYSLYKNITVTMTQIWYQWYTQFSGALYYEPWAGSCYNVVWTLFPIIMLAIFERPYSDKVAIENPELYRDGPQNKFFNLPLLMKYELLGVLSSVPIFWVPTIVMDGTINSKGQVMELWASMTTMFTCCILTVTGKIMIETHTWTRCNVIWFALSVILWFLYAVIFALLPVTWSGWGETLFNYAVPSNCMDTPEFWLLCFIVPVFCLAPELTYRYFSRKWFPSELEKIQLDQQSRGREEGDEFQSTLPGRRSISMQRPTETWSTKPQGNKDCGGSD